MSPEQQAELLVRIDEKLNALGDVAGRIEGKVDKHVEDDDKTHKELYSKVNANKTWITRFQVLLGIGVTGGGGAAWWEFFK